MEKRKGSATGADLLTASEVGAYLRLSLSTVYYLSHQGKLGGFRVGRAWRFRTDEIARIAGASLNFEAALDRSLDVSPSANRRSGSSLVEPESHDDQR